MVEVIQRKRPRQQRSLVTVDAVLEAATRILDSDGLPGFNTNAVARRAGVSIGSLYQYFPNKEAITTALILRSHERIVAGIEAILVETEGLAVAPAITAMLHMLIDGQTATPLAERVLEAEEMRLPKTADILAAERRIENLNIAFFARYLDPKRVDQDGLRIAAADTICIVRSLLDSADPATPGLLMRLQRAVEGYLEPLIRRSGL